MTPTRSLVALVLYSGLSLTALGCNRGQEAPDPSDAGTGTSKPKDGGIDAGSPPRMNAGRPGTGPNPKGPNPSLQAGNGTAGYYAGQGGYDGDRYYGGTGGYYVPPYYAGTGGWAGGVGPVFGGVGGGEFWHGGSGGLPCDCDDGDPCTMDYCSNFGRCRHDTLITARIDGDEDGYFQGCDCNDEDPLAHPGQSQFFSGPPNEAPDLSAFHDYDCDYNVTRLLTSDARACELHPAGDACLGEGWLVEGDQPDCGEEGTYQICEYADGTCVARELTTVQRCR